MRSRRFRVLIGTGVICGAMAVTGASAAAATAAQLKVTVAPAQVRPQQTYAITIIGHYGKNVQTTPHLFAFIQYSGRACRLTATAEYALPTSSWGWLLYPPTAQPYSTIKRVLYEQAMARLGWRRVCAYLYAGMIAPQSNASPLAVASALFRNVKQP